MIFFRTQAFFHMFGKFCKCKTFITPSSFVRFWKFKISNRLEFSQEFIFLNIFFLSGFFHLHWKFWKIGKSWKSLLYGEKPKKIEKFWNNHEGNELEERSNELLIEGKKRLEFDWFWRYGKCWKILLFSWTYLFCKIIIWISKFGKFTVFC